MITMYSVDTLNCYGPYHWKNTQQMSLESSTVGGRTKIKMVLLGDQSVGKSAIIDRYVNEKFNEVGCSTVGIDFLVRNTHYRDRGFRLQLWDTAGQERFRSLIPSYLKDAICCLIVFDVTKRQSLANAKLWLEMYKESKPEPRRAILVGNKTDLSVRTVSKAEGEAKAKEFRIPYIEVSAKTGKRLEELFDLVIELSVYQVQPQMDEVQQVDEKKVDESTSAVSKEQPVHPFELKLEQRSFPINPVSMPPKRECKC